MLLKYTVVYKGSCIPQLKRSNTKKRKHVLLNISYVMAKGQNETSRLRHQTLCEIQPNEVFLSGFIALCPFFFLLHEAKFQKPRWKWRTMIIEATSIQDTMRQRKTNKWKHYTDN